MSQSSWEVILNFRSDNGSETTIKVTGSWESGGHQRASDECIALDMAAVIKMLQASPFLIGPSDGKSTIEAFEDGWA